MKSLETDLQAITALQQWGVPFLSAPSRACSDFHTFDLPDLLAYLIQSASPRLKLAVTAFFIVHPEEAPAALETLSLLPENSKPLFKYYYSAALYLQSLWKTQLARFGEEWLPDYFSKELGFPGPSLLQARLGLLAVEEKLQEWIHEPYHYQASFDSLIQLLQQRG